jgi:ribulose-phosphate 3-epimerase
MDGHFVPTLTFGPPLIRAARSHTGLPFDVHLMVTDAAAYVPQLAGLGVSIMSFQIETTNFAPRLCSLIREHGMRPAVALNPATPLAAIEEVLPLVDYVLLMSVDPGFAGQSFLPGTFAKIEKLAAFRDEHELVFGIEVDGGVNLNNIDELAGSGVDTVVAGKAFFTAEDPGAFTDAVHRAGRISG